MNEWGSREPPVFTADIMMTGVATGVDSDAEDDEDGDGNDFQQTEPVLQLGTF